MSQTKIRKLINQKVADELGLSEVRGRINRNLKYLIEHPLFNTNIFIDDDKEFIKNYLETAEACLIDDIADKNIDKFLNLFNTQIEMLKADFDHLYKFIKSDDNYESKTLISSKIIFRDSFDNSDNENFNYDQEQFKLIHRIKHGVASLVDVAKQFHNLYEAVNKAIPPFLDDAMQRVTDELISFRRIRNIADNAKTENIYDHAVIKYRGLENNYRWYFYWAIGLTVGISLVTFFLKKILVPGFLGNVEFWVLKASVLAVGITLVTYFLKQSTHYQRLADQNYQTQVELQAYPTFMESIPTEEAAAVRKELALKYFGREIDGSAHKDMGNLISDQIKSTTEMVKATTDVLKVRGGNNGS
ncbi:hypothetical protein [Acinetobacter bereziniae]|uniref:hypothetical protein n=1 Tax=Acinetobacter bereziniae TaxID=106648 RepID=UPI00124DA1B4|nr:hypothetical protein [Acinetobacter bereziniae]